MKLTIKTEYACLALITLSNAYTQGQRKTIAEIATEQDIPKKYLEQILLLLKNGSFVKSYKGPEGGYQLAKSPSEITLAQLIRYMEGALAPVESASKYFYESTPVEKSEKLLSVFRDIRNYISDKLENVTFADLI